MEQTSNLFQQLIQGVRLAQEPLDTALRDHVPYSVAGDMAGAQQNGDCPVQVPDGLHDFAGGHARHGHVQQDEADANRMISQHVEGRCPIRCCQDCISAPAQESLSDCTHDRLVFDYQDSSAAQVQGERTGSKGLDGFFQAAGEVDIKGRAGTFCRYCRDPASGLLDGTVDDLEPQSRARTYRLGRMEGLE